MRKAALPDTMPKWEMPLALAAHAQCARRTASRATVQRSVLFAGTSHTSRSMASADLNVLQVIMRTVPATLVEIATSVHHPATCARLGRFALNVLKLHTSLPQAAVPINVLMAITTRDLRRLVVSARFALQPVRHVWVKGSAPCAKTTPT